MLANAGCTWAPGTSPLRTLSDVVEFNKNRFLLEFQGGQCCRGDPVYAQYYQQSFETAKVSMGIDGTLFMQSTTNSTTKMVTPTVLPAVIQKW